MLPSEQKIIDDCIVEDEGGWVLTAHADDPDGGWTFAGVTSTLWKSVNPDRPFTHDQMAHYVAGTFSAIKNEIYDLYYKEFYAPLEKDIYPKLMRPAYYSAAINLGVQKAVNLILQPTSVATLTEFLHRWHVHYITLVVANASAWREYAVDLENDFSGRNATKPTTLRAVNSLGWFNRVEHYRPAD